jgi:hypothetical protein
MHKNELDGFTVGDLVAFKGEHQRMTITHLETKWFKDNTCDVIYQLDDKKMHVLGNVPLKSIIIIKKDI